jgi:cell division protein FtsB
LGKVKDIFTGEHRRLAWFTVVATAVFVIMKLFGPGNTVIHWIQAKREIVRQEKQMEQYRREIEAMDQNIDELKTNPDSLEKFAREQFGFAVPGEDVYIVN